MWKEQHSLPASEAEATGIKRITRLGAVHFPDINSTDPAEKNSVLWPWQRPQACPGLCTGWCTAGPVLAEDHSAPLLEHHGKNSRPQACLGL